MQESKSKCINMDKIAILVNGMINEDVSILSVMLNMDTEGPFLTCNSRNSIAGSQILFISIQGCYLRDKRV